MSSLDADVVIVGGGCAGLSLGVRLAEQPGRCRRVVILESRQRYQNDRTWCFWRVARHRHDSLVDYSWSNMAVRAGSRRIQVSCADTPYQRLRAEAFYADACARIEHGPEVELHLGRGVRGAPRRADGHWVIGTDAGELRTRTVVDTRPPQAPRAADALLWQSFRGDEVSITRDLFDPSTAMLMDFAPDDERGIVFSYVLPTSPRRALVETTVFGIRPLTSRDLADQHDLTIQQACQGTPETVLHSEHGLLPMGPRAIAPQPGPNHVRAGLMGGAARPATGYAFQRIQAWADICAAALRSGAAPCGHPPEPRLTRWMDGLFLRVLRAQPARGPELFVRLFAGVDPARIVRFLSDCPTAADRMAIIASLPPGVFLRQLFASPRPSAHEGGGI